MNPVLSHDLLIAGGGTLAIGVVLIVVGRALARAGASPLVTRKVPHALCGLFAAAAAFQLTQGPTVAAVLAAATVALAVIVERGLVPVPGVFDGTRSRDYGLVGFAGGALVAVLAFWPDRVAIAGGVLVLGLADAAAALVGNRFGRHPVATLGAVRSLEGSLVFVAVAAAVAFGCCRIGFGLATPTALVVALFVGLTTAAVELLVLPAADNLLITPWVALLLHLAPALTGAEVTRWLFAAAFGAALVPALVAMGWLDLPGGICGGLVAAVAIGLGGPAWLVAPAVFFAVTSQLTAYGRPKQDGGLRGLSQVVVNAGLPVIAPVLGYALTGAPVWFAVSIGGVAAGIADTWASEIGRFAKRAPISLRTLAPVPAGTSGAVSPLGFGATALGALLVGVAGAALAGPAVGAGPHGLAPVAAAVAAAGVAAGVIGSLTDSALGASVQARFSCRGCGVTTEERRHCAEPARPLSGWAWLDNNAVNACANVVGMVVAFAVYAAIPVR